MFDYQPVIIAPNLFAAIAVLIVGFAACWANPSRAINRYFFTVSAHVTVWLLFLHFAQAIDDGLIWVRYACATGAFLPLHLWFLKDAIVSPREKWWKRFVQGRIWVALSVPLAIVPYTGWFVPAHSTQENPVYGWGYYGYVICACALYAGLFRDTLVKMRQESGVTRIELQILLLGGSSACALVLILMGIRGVFGTSFPVPPQPIVVLIVYSAMVLAITTHRIFDARFLVLLAVQRVLLITSISAAAVLLYFAVSTLVPTLVAFVSTVAGSLWIASHLGIWLDHALGRFPQETQARKIALAAARKGRNFDELSADFTAILKGWGTVDRVLILSSVGEGYNGSGLKLDENAIEVQVLEQLRWATPERLGRERESAGREALLRCIKEHSLGAIVFARGPTLAVIAGVGVRPTRKPFTYPEVRQLVDLTMVFESALAQTHLLAKAQRAEQLATVGVLGASVAHEIRNPLVTIKSFVHLLPHHYEDRAFRERFFRLISEEVGRIDRLTEQLLDLASPRHYNPVPTSLHQVISSSLELVATKAEERQTTLQPELQASPDIIFTDPNATRQVLLNLCFNGIQAQERTDRERWLRLSTRNVPRGVELCVADNGPGIPTESRVHLFQAFHSTKSSGFGLGLAICNEILSSLDARISVDPYVPGQGAIFRIVFPCPPRTS